MKIFEINYCKYPDCPFYKKIVVKNKIELGLCDREKRYITESDHSGCNSDNKSELIYIEGSFPKWCPLTDLFDNVIWEV